MKKFFLLMSSMIVLFLQFSVFAESTSYPSKASYPNGIDNASSSLFLNSKINRPIDTGFEDRDEIDLIKSKDQSGQLSISEEAYSGKFALHIQKKEDNIIPIRETNYFQTGVETTEIKPDTISGINVQINDKMVNVSGVKSSCEMVSLLVEKGSTIAYINQTTADSNGFYSFTFPIKEYGTYKMKIGGSKSELITTTLQFNKESVTTQTPSSSIENSSVGIDAKCNFYNVMLKPMYQSETISFYVRVNIKDENGNTSEQYALIKSDKDGDGSFRVGEDLSRGRWQELQLSLTDIDVPFQNGTAAGIYMKSNKGSEWILDDITSGYRVINETNIDLSKFAADNVIHTDEGLQFADNAQNDGYNSSSRVVTGGINITDQISEINVDSSLKYSTGDKPYRENAKQILHSFPLESEKWIVNDIDYDTQETGVSKKTSKRYFRETLPELPSSYTMKIERCADTEARFRLIMSDIGTYNTPNLTITDQDGNDKVYTLSENKTYTDWFDNDITLDCNRNLYDNLCLWGIEYEPVEENSDISIAMRSQGSAMIDLETLVTDDRVKISYNLDYVSGGTPRNGTQLELYEENSDIPYYSTRTNVDSTCTHQNISHIVPKIRENTKMKIINLEELTTEEIYDELYLSNVRITQLEESDWNKAINYGNYSLLKRENNLGTDTLPIVEEQYAVVYQDLSGIVNKKTYYYGPDNDESLVYECDFIIYRILNLNTEPVYVEPGSQDNIWLNYGLNDYVVQGKQKYIYLPPSDKVMLVAKSYYSNTDVNPNNLHLVNKDGLFEGEITSDGTKILYSHMYDSNFLYEYDIVEDVNKKLYEDTLISVSPDETHLLLKNKDGQYYILDRTNMKIEVTTLSNRYNQYFFNSKNELFVSNKTLYYYTTDGIRELVDSGYNKSSKYTCYDFDSSGEYLLWSYHNYIYLYKNSNGIWNKISHFTADEEIIRCFLSDDISTAYIQMFGSIYTIDLKTNIIKPLFEGASVLQLTDNNMLIINDYDSYDDYYCLYNPVTGDKYKIFNEPFTCSSIHYNTETGIITGILPNGSILRYHFTAEESDARYALSFDGRDNWYAYSGGRWLTVSKENTPNTEEMQITGMTADVINSIPASTYDRLYSNGDDILTVDVAIYMYSNTSKQTPVIENITVKTIEKDDSSSLYGIHMEKYEKEKYRSINSLFPIENFGSNAECYYLLYIGNDWLYTYKNNELVKVNESADTLLTDMSKSWITFKQYGMDAQELRRIPGEILSKLFVNEDYANTEFGVIYVVKAADDDTAEYTVTFRLSSSTNFIVEEDIVVEIMMNGGDVKVINSADFSSTDIENLLSWIEARQNGSGEIFYRLKNEKIQHFINYYMINSISVYNADEYRSKSAE